MRESNDPRDEVENVSSGDECDSSSESDSEGGDSINGFDKTDPFASRARILHPALALNHSIDADIDPELFNSFFATEAFKAWSSGTRSWQLHCYGDPGSGKTTLAAVVAQRLAQRGDAVASISIIGHVKSTSLAFVEDLMQSMHNQIGNQSSDEFAAYQTACSEGHPITERIKRLSAAISSSHSTKHLILDGYDLINPALQRVLDTELYLLQHHSLKVLLTRRVPAFCTPTNPACDICDEEELNTWWVCRKCREDGKEFWLCYPCKEKLNSDCRNCKNAVSFEEDYEHVNVKVGGMGQGLENLARERLKGYFGDVEDETLQMVVEYVHSKAAGNITLTLLYLEEIFAWGDLSTFDPVRIDDRLPRDVIAFFDAEMKIIDQLNDTERHTTMLAIAAAATTDDGVPLTELEECVRLAMPAPPDIDSPRSLEDVFQAANGWLVDPRTRDREVATCCAPAFALYAQENYNESLAWARREMGYDGADDSSSETSRQVDHTPKPSGSTFDTFSDHSVNPTPAGSTEHSLDGVENTVVAHRPLFLEEEQGLTHSPPRSDSHEVPRPISLPTRTTSQTLVAAQESEPSSICDFCRHHILESGVLSGEHHSDKDSATASMEKCLFCAALYKSGMSIGDSSDDATPWPLYHWTLRIAPRGRELQSSMVLSFRFKHARIPSKSFRVLPEASLNVPSINQVSKFTDPALSGGSQIKAWIESCNNDHSGCSKTSSSTWVPTRLLDLESGDPNKVRLVDTRVSRIKGPYCTLSHAWGKITITITTVWNMAQFLLDGIPLSDLSNTFRQAIEVARFLKIRYIWIDSLCIVQQPYGDFAKEGDLMHKVYRYSYCNLVATDSINGQGGLFRERGPSAVLPVKYHGRGTNRAFREESWVIVPADIWEEELLSSFIYTRGWVFQERMLSPRLLHFSKNQIFWDCGTLSACETFPSGLPFSLDHKAGTDRHWRGRLDQPDQSSADITGPNDNESPYTFWRSAVESYTVCNLTSQTDKTVAIWSVAKLLRDITDEGYAVGMWATELEEQLAWRVEDVQGSERVPELQLNIPSWSWASVKGHIIPHHRLVTRDYRVTNHQGDDISFAVETQANRDTEPKLKSRSLAIQGVINIGTLAKAARNRYRIEVQIEPMKSFYLDVIPDGVSELDTNKLLGRLESPCQFVVLAASSSKILGVDPAANEAIHTTHSGVGVLLTTRSSWFSRQEEQLPELQDRIARSEGETKKELEFRAQSIKSLLLQRTQVDVSEAERHYRRVGAVYFRDLDEMAYKWLQRESPSDFWLD